MIDLGLVLALEELFSDVLELLDLPLDRLEDGSASELEGRIRGRIETLRLVEKIQEAKP